MTPLNHYMTILAGLAAKPAPGAKSDGRCEAVFHIPGINLRCTDEVRGARYGLWCLYPIKTIIRLFLQYASNKHQHPRFLDSYLAVYVIFYFIFMIFQPVKWQY